MSHARNQEKKKRGKALIVLLSIVFVIVAAGVSVVLSDAPARAELQQMTLAEVDFGNLNDGVYRGEYHGTKNSLRDVVVEVTVTAGTLAKITVIEDASAGAGGRF
ncbi:MAG: hypothetical protein WDA00_02245 [Eubacteriales bacterium]